MKTQLSELDQQRLKEAIEGNKFFKANIDYVIEDNYGKPIVSQSVVFSNGELTIIRPDHGFFGGNNRIISRGNISNVSEANNLIAASLQQK